MLIGAIHLSKDSEDDDWVIDWAKQFVSGWEHEPFHLGQLSSYGQWIHASVGIARETLGACWPRKVLFTDYQVMDRLFLWTSLGQPDMLVVLLHPVC